MKKTIIAAITFITLAAGSSFAQRVYTSPYDNRPSQHGYDRDQFQDELKINRIDAIVNLSRRQEKQLHRIEDQYDRMMNSPRVNNREVRQLQLRKRQDMLAVLTPAQRDRLFAYEQNGHYSRNQPMPNNRRY